jgi:hypothetical protein
VAGVSGAIYKAAGGRILDPEYEKVAPAGAGHVVVTHAPVPVQDKEFRRVRVTDPSTLPEIMLDLFSRKRMLVGHLTALFKAHFVDQKIREALAALLAPGHVDPALVRLISKQAHDLSPGDIGPGWIGCLFSWDGPHALRCSRFFGTTITSTNNDTNTGFPTRAVTNPSQLDECDRWSAATDSGGAARATPAGPAEGLQRSPPDGMRRARRARDLERQHVRLAFHCGRSGTSTDHRCPTASIRRLMGGPFRASGTLTVS